MTPSEQDERIIEYLLGELPEAESSLMEEQYLASQDTFRQMQEIEAELHDAYARGSLSRERRLRFEQQLLATPRQLQRLEFSRAMIQAQSSSRRPLVWTSLPKPAILAIGIAAMLTIAIGVWWTTSQKLRVQVAQPAIESRSPIVVVATLVPGATRAAGEEFTIKLPANADVLRLTAGLERDSHPSYNAVLRTPEGVESWRNSDLHSQLNAAAPSVILDIPATSLVSGHYALTLSGDKPDGTTEDIVDYSFRVQKP
jgi:hypothetical protein